MREPGPYQETFWLVVFALEVGLFLPHEHEVDSCDRDSILFASQLILDIYAYMFVYVYVCVYVCVRVCI